MRPVEMERRIQLSINNSLRDISFKWIQNENEKETLQEYLKYCKKVESWEHQEGYNPKKNYQCFETLGYISDRFQSYQRIDWLLYCCEGERL